jgi:predicted phage terminase large subunit-like protein
VGSTLIWLADRKQSASLHYHDAAPDQAFERNHQRPNHGGDGWFDLREPEQSFGKVFVGIQRKYEGSRLGRQELYADILEDFEGALWKRTLIDALRVKLEDVPLIERIVVAIDPNASSEEDSNECGIICAGLGVNGHGYVLDDVSSVMTPAEWAAEAINLYHRRRADRIIAETNNGGEMVENTIRMIDPNVPYGGVWASRGKVTRAEPVSALYEQGRVHHVGSFARLEDQMCSFTVDFNRREMGYSPDRVDALVWALTELLIEGEGRRLLIA